MATACHLPDLPTLSRDGRKRWGNPTNGGNLDFHHWWELQTHLSDYLTGIGAGGYR